MRPSKANASFCGVWEFLGFRNALSPQPEMMTICSVLLALCLLTSQIDGIAAFTPLQPTYSRTSTALGAVADDASPALTLYGHPGTRSPLVNWACHELGVDFTMGNLSNNPHPFGQIPCLTAGSDDAVLFESGAILQYLNFEFASSTLTKSQMAAVISWITWANASLDPICFLETPDGKVYDTGLKQPNNKRISKLETMLGTQDFLVNEAGFTIADVAVASYLL